MSDVKGKNNKPEDSIPDDQKTKKILVVGDWFVDEHWVMGVHRSATSSRTGDAHYRALHNMSSTVQSFCGAGLTASLLYQVEEKNKRLFDIFGIGLWHHNDTAILKEMFEVEHLKGQTLFKINRQPPNPPPGVELINLSDLLIEKDREKICTTRIIRLYHSVHPDDVKFYRMDWELPRVEIQNDKIEELDSKLPPKIDAVVIKDLLKGVVSPHLVAKLVEKYGKNGKNAQWFVSSKAWNPTWLKELRDVDLQLLIIPQIAADEAIRKGILSCWITRAGYPGEDVFECINEIIDKIGPQKPGFKLIILPKGFSVIAYMPYKKLDEQEKIDCIIQPEVTPHPPIVPMGMASVFLPAIISDHLQHGGEEKKFREVLENCLRCTYKWVKFQGKRVMQPEDWDPKSESGKFMKLDSNDEAISECHFVFKNVAWKNEQKIWKQATYGTGVINVKSNKKPKKYLELWRSMIEVDGYVCCVKGKRKELHRLITGIGGFCKGEKKHHVGCMLVAAPGSGKSSLVRRLANSLNLRFLPFNITQMSSRNDIIDCFDTIVTTQAQDRTQPILVFIDEINAKLDNSPVYDAFLAPIEDGVYIRGGKAFHIDPCIWIFAGTENIEELEASDTDNADKKSDFISRLELGVMDLKQSEDVHRRKIENLYLSVSLLLNEFPDVRYITEKVLKAFKEFPSHVCARDIEHLIKAFKNIQYGKVKSGNIPKERLSKIKNFDFKKWEDRPEGYEVEIKELPSRNIIDEIASINGSQ